MQTNSALATVLQTGKLVEVVAVNLGSSARLKGGVKYGMASCFLNTQVWLFEPEAANYGVGKG